MHHCQKKMCKPQNSIFLVKIHLIHVRCQCQNCTQLSKTHVTAPSVIQKWNYGSKKKIKLMRIQAPRCCCICWCYCEESHQSPKKSTVQETTDDGLQQREDQNTFKLKISIYYCKYLRITEAYKLKVKRFIQSILLSHFIPYNLLSVVMHSNFQYVYKYIKYNIYIYISTYIELDIQTQIQTSDLYNIYKYISWRSLYISTYVYIFLYVYYA